MSLNHNLKHNKIVHRANMAGLYIAPLNNLRFVIIAFIQTGFHTGDMQTS